MLYPEQLLILRLPSIVANRPSLAQWATDAPMEIPGALHPSLLSKFSTDLKSASILSVLEDRKPMLLACHKKSYLTESQS